MKCSSVKSAILLLASWVTLARAGVYVQRGASYPFPRPLTPPPIPPIPPLPAIPAVPAVSSILAAGQPASWQPRITNSGPVRPLIDGIRWPSAANFQWPRGPSVTFPSVAIPAIASSQKPGKRGAKKNPKRVATSAQASAVAVASSAGRSSAAVATSVSG